MFDRRQMLTTSLTGFAAFAMRSGIAHGFSTALESAARRCIILWMDGGPSQFETFDPKPGAATGGPTQAIPTDVADLRLSEHLPMLARHADDLNVIRTLTSSEGEHTRAKYLNHTGFVPISAFPRPELGSLFAHHLHRGELPGFITLGGAGYGPAYLGERFAPFTIEDPSKTIRLLKELRSGKNRFRLLDSLASDFDSRFNGGRIQQRKAKLSRVEGLLDTKLTELLNVSAEPSSTIKRYGEGKFAGNLLLARRLIEAGVACVEVQLGGWDTHRNNFTAVADLCRQLDRPWATLIDDLKRRNLWNDTLLIWMGDFGRTPTINATNGRDHFPAISNAVLAGGGLPGGQVIGKTNSLGNKIEDRPIATADLFATILHQIRIAPDQEYQTSFGSPTQVTDGGSVVKELA